MISADNLPITEDWLKESGFKWHQLERQTNKMWVLWMGAVAAFNPNTGRQDGFSSDEDLGIEITACDPLNPSKKSKFTSQFAGQWSVWLRADYSGRYSRFIHIRHMRFQHEVIALVESCSGVKWNVANHRYGKIFTSEQVKAIDARDKRLDFQIARDRPWHDQEKDESRGRALPEHKQQSEGGEQL